MATCAFGTTLLFSSFSIEPSSIFTYFMYFAKYFSKNHFYSFSLETNFIVYTSKTPKDIVLLKPKDPIVFINERNNEND